jgi:putative hydrolase of the HAD superfamily
MTIIVSFDLDGTLTTSAFADAVWLDGLPRLYAQTSGKDLEAAKRELFAEYDRISDQRQEWYDPAYWYDYYHLPGDWRTLLHQNRAHIACYPDVPKVLPRLATRYQLIINSNAKREFIDIQLQELHLLDYFTHIFSSTSDFHTVKKVNEFYLKTCQRLSVNPSQVVHIGDSKRFDYDAPRSAGMSAYFLDRSGKEHGPYIVHSLLEFEDKFTKK